MFQFPGFASPLREMIGLATDRVAPFGNPGITACLQLPQAYRSLPRPSSPPCAKASTVRPYALDLTTLSVSVGAVTTTNTTRQLSKNEKKRRWPSVESAGEKFRGLSIPRLTARAYSALQKGGDPAAGSPTATLLRLRPSH